ncbi:exonuclease domain-containing protein [Bacillus sp. S14(2024)]|uniref:exonuclease domain-containing protein n=1 Tax=Bacillus sp. S14(2024) TaxID=3162884 RepID=UPI003D194CDD
MKFIIVDLEWNPVHRNGKLINQDITEIGAVEVSEVDGMVMIGRKFHSYVRPFNPISKKIKELTNLQEPDTWLAPKFSLVINRFDKWIGNESYIFCSWGEDDRNVLLKNLLLHHLDVKSFKHYFNLQSAFSKMVDEQSRNQVGLIKAIESLGLIFEGAPHCSVDDAYNTARVFTKVYNEILVTPEPFVNNLVLDIDYRNRVNKVKHLRTKFKLSYQDLSLISKISEEELEQIESFQLTKNKKEITRLIKLLYSIRGETIGKR